MGYDLHPKKKGVESFHFGVFSWVPLLEACGLLWPATFSHGQWYCVFGVDARLGEKYPHIISNDGMEITAEEAKIMARCARNLVAIQRSLPESHADQSAMGRNLMTQAMTGGVNREWPVKLRSDFVDRYEEFAEWVPKSGGFTIH